MATRRMIGKIAPEDSLAIHSCKSNGTLALISQLFKKNYASDIHEKSYNIFRFLSAIGEIKFLWLCNDS